MNLLGSIPQTISMLRQEKFLSDLASSLQTTKIGGSQGDACAGIQSMNSLKSLQEFFRDRVADCVLHIAADFEAISLFLKGSTLERVWLDEFFPWIKNLRNGVESFAP
jgi:hypothetical protein